MWSPNKSQTIWILSIWEIKMRRTDLYGQQFVSFPQYCCGGNTHHIKIKLPVSFFFLIYEISNNYINGLLTYTAFQIFDGGDAMYWGRGQKGNQQRATSASSSQRHGAWTTAGCEFGNKLRGGGREEDVWLQAEKTGFILILKIPHLSDIFIYFRFEFKLTGWLHIN